MKLGDQPPKAGTIRGVLLATEQSGNDIVCRAHGNRRALLGRRAAGAAAASPTARRRDSRRPRCPSCFCSPSWAA